MYEIVIPLVCLFKFIKTFFQFIYQVSMLYEHGFQYFWNSFQFLKFKRKKSNVKKYKELYKNAGKN